MSERPPCTLPCRQRPQYAKAAVAAQEFGVGGQGGLGQKAPGDYVRTEDPHRLLKTAPRSRT